MFRIWVKSWDSSAVKNWVWVGVSRRFAFSAWSREEAKCFFASLSLAKGAIKSDLFMSFIPFSE